MLERRLPLFDPPLLGGAPEPRPAQRTRPHRSAKVSACGRYRWTLSRWWGNGSRVCWIMLNPSTADASVDDPTIRRCIQFSRSRGYSGLTVVNLYPFRSSSPDECRAWADYEKNGPDWYARDAILFTNLPLVVRTAKAAPLVIAAWGAAPWARDFGEYVREQIQEGVAPYPAIHCLGVTALDDPKHPMARGKHRVPDDQRPVLWRSAPELGKP